jgi:hypothetical protein
MQTQEFAKIVLCFVDLSLNSVLKGVGKFRKLLDNKINLVKHIYLSIVSELVVSI